MTIEIRQEEVGDVRVLALAGRLDTETAADLELALQDLRDAGASRFVIDLGEIGYVSSAGLRVLLALAKQLDGGRGTLKLCALNDAVRQVFDVAGFSRMFAIFNDRDAALGAAAKAPAQPAPAAAKPKPAAPPRQASPPAPVPSPPPAAPAAAPVAPPKAPAPPPAASASPPPPPAASELTRAAASLLGAEEPASPVSPGSAELARAAADLLGGSGKSNAPAKPAAEKKPKAQPAPKPAKPATSTEPTEPAPAEPAGVLGKFRSLFGKK
jgi:anti-sigma B factor antagonist